MKKLCCIFLTLCLLLTGCGKNKIPKIDAYTWEMTSVQSMDANGQAVAYGDRGSSTLDSAVYMELTCTAEAGILTFTDQTNGKSYSGTYSLSGTDPRSVLYQVTVDGKEGFAVVAMTTYHDGTGEPTFIINLDDYAINFFAA